MWPYIWKYINILFIFLSFRNCNCIVFDWYQFFPKLYYSVRIIYLERFREIYFQFNCKYCLILSIISRREKFKIILFHASSEQKRVFFVFFFKFALLQIFSYLYPQYIRIYSINILLGSSEDVSENNRMEYFVKYYDQEFLAIIANINILIRKILDA